MPAVSNRVARDPVTGRSVAEQTVHLDSKAIGHPKILYRAKASGRAYVITADVYKFQGEPMKIHIMCPLCGERGVENALTINEGHKHIEYDANAPLSMMLPNEQGETTLMDMGGTLSVERIGCTWEEKITAEVSRATGTLQGTNLCRWRVVIENNIAKDA